ncbi:DUF4261 domain-containing protein [Roseimaritima ulvae]|uniref:DUF4261 domain-containing protein n=1 Tax=Roseimaritima ulvae TaxID=980254 RepID=A0A5B9QS22_9BACT|nr:DUF4261 domain-containing protein [Roseimaritima ulvae]QEG40500.1 hypothetical protein UC8_25120 [Roseimaritima ulvae]
MAIAISMVLFSDEPRLSVADIQRDFTSRWPDVPEPTEAEEDENTLSFNVGDSLVILAVMPVPFPASDLEGPCATSVLWPKAADELEDHQSHAIVTVNGDLDPLALSTLLTQATTSVLATSATALGVYWGNATLIVPKPLFVDIATEILPQTPPLPIWVDFRIGTDGEQTSAGFTAGMKALGHMEFETQQAAEPPGELRDRLMSLAAYVVENGPVIKDGHTVGEDANERIRVVFSDSAFGHEEQVMRLVYEQASPAKPWWKLW